MGRGRCGSSQATGSADQRQKEARRGSSVAHLSRVMHRRRMLPFAAAMFAVLGQHQSHSMVTLVLQLCQRHTSGTLYMSPSRCFA